MKSDDKPRKKTKRRIFFVVGVVLLFVGAALGTWHYNARQNAWGKVNFQEYAPSYLPGKLSIVSKSVDARYVPTNNPAHTTTLNLKLSQRSFIYEQKAGKSFSYSCGQSIVNTSCIVASSTRGQRFLLTTTTVSGQSTQQVITWSQGGTDMRLVLHGEVSQPYSSDTAGKIIDSFHKVRYTGLHVNYYDNSKI
jgi:hypothetical protein